MHLFRSRVAAIALLISGCVGLLHGQSGVALVRHAPAINGTLDGSLQQMLAEDVTLNGGGAVTGSLYMLGTPRLKLNGKPAFGGTITGTGAATPTNHTVTLNGNAQLGHLVTRVDTLAIPTVTPPPAPTGTRTATVNKGGATTLDFTGLRDLTLNGNAGQVVVPAGNYGDFNANGGSGFTLGVAGGTQPLVYNFQHLTLNGGSQLQVVGPVIITIANSLSLNGAVGAGAHPEWLQLRVAGGDLTVNGNVALFGYVTAPRGTVTINGNSQLIGGLASDQLTLNGNSLLRLIDLVPTVALTAPAENTVITAPIASLTLTATGADTDGAVAKVAFFAGSTKIGETVAAPYQITWANIPAGTYSLTAVATDNAGVSTTSAQVTLIANAPPTVALSAPAADAVFTAPGAITLTANAADSDGTVAKVEFFNGSTKVGEALAAPFQVEWTGVPYGTYTLTATATDNLGAATTSAPVSIVVNQPPAVSVTTPKTGDLLIGPATLTLTASASDVDGSIAQVSFFNGSVKLGDATASAAQPSVFTLPVTLAPDVYSITAIATDNLGASTTSAAVKLTIDAPPTATLTAPVNGAVVTAPASVTLAANASDADGTIAKVEFLQGSTVIGTVTAAPYTYAVSNLAAGAYTFGARAADNVGAVSSLSTASIIVNAPPTVGITAPADHATFALGKAITMTADAADSDGTVARVEFFQGNVKLGEATTAPFTMSWTNAAVGHYAITARATDDRGAATVSATVNVIVDTPPTATAQTLTVTAGKPADVVLAGTDAESDPLTFAIVVAPAHGTLTGTAPNLTYTAAKDYAGADTFTFKANDGMLDSAEATVAITVNPANQPPVANAQTVSAQYGVPVTITLTGSDPDSDPLVYTVVTSPAHGTLTGTAPSLTYTATAGYVGADSLVFKVNDGHVDSPTATVAIDVAAPQNHAPVVGAGPDQVILVKSVRPTNVKIVVNNDDWTFSSAGLQQAPSALQFVRNIANEFSGGRPGKFLAYSSNFGLTSPELANAMASDGHSWTVGTTQPFTLATLLQYDGVFLVGGSGDNQALIDYVRAGGHVYVGAGTGPGDGVQWNVFLNTFGLTYLPDMNTLAAPVTITSDHRLLGGVDSLLYINGTRIARLSDTDPFTEIINSSGAESLLAIYSEPTIDVTLSGTATDDGLPNGTLAYHWQLIGGPENVSIATPDALTTRVRLFSRTGTFVFRLTADDSKLTGYGDVKVVVNSNRPPFAAPGGPYNASDVSQKIALGGIVSDDGEPVGGSLTSHWAKVDGPGTVAFDSADLPQTQVQFSAPGIYLLSLTASDGLESTTSTTEARVGPAWQNLPSGLAAWWPGNGSLKDVVGGHDLVMRGNASYSAGAVSLAANFDGYVNVGRASAHVDLDVGAGAGFTVELWANPSDMRDKPLVSWNNGSQSGVLFQIRDGGRRLSADIVDAAGISHFMQSDYVITAKTWQHLAVTYDRSSGVARLYRNGVMITSANLGSFVPQTSYDLFVGGMPRDSRLYCGGLDEITLYRRALRPSEIYSLAKLSFGKPPILDNKAPAVIAGAGSDALTVKDIVSLNGVVTDDGKPFNGLLSSAWSCISGPGTVQFADPSSPTTTAIFENPGLYVLQLSANDGASTAAAQTEVRVASSGKFEDPDAIVAWWPGNGDSRDIVGGHDLELVNGTSFAPGKVALGFNFDGSSSYAIATACADLDVGSREGFTFECWVNPANLNEVSLAEWNSGQNSGPAISIRDGGRFAVNLVSTTGANFLVQTERIAQVGTWQHIAVTYDKVSGVARIFRNAALVAESTVGGMTLQTSSDLYIGSRPNSYGRTLNGLIDEPALYRRALRLDEIYQIFTAPVGKCPMVGNHKPVVGAGPDIALADPSTVANLTGFAADDGRPGPLTTRWSKEDGIGNVSFGSPSLPTTSASFDAPGLYTLRLHADDGLLSSDGFLDVRIGLPTPAPTFPGLVAWWRGNANPIESVNGIYMAELLNGTSFGVGKVGSGFHFDGVSNRLHIPANPQTDIGASSLGFTIEFWARPEQIRTQPLIHWQTDAKEGMSIWIRDTGAVATYMPNGVYMVTSPQVDAGAWQHFALTLDKSTGNVAFYKNGKAVATATVGTGYRAPTSLDVWMGGVPAYPNNYFVGTLDEVSFYDRPLIPAQIAAIFDAGAAGKSSSPTNLPPVVRAVGGKTAYVGYPVQLSGTAIDDGLPTPPAALTYQWSVVAGAGNVTFSAPTSAATTATFDTAGNYTLRLTASDSARSDFDDVQVSVTQPASIPPTITIYQPANGANLAIGTPFEIDAHAADADGTIAKVEFFQGTTKLGEQTAPAADDATTYFWPFAAGLPAGNYTFSAVATDNTGVVTASAPVTIGVIADPGVPVARISTPDDLARVSAPTAVTGLVQTALIAKWQLQYRLKAAEGTADEPWIAFASGTQQVGSPASGSTPATPGALGTFDPTSLINGIYEIQLKVTDTSGRTVVDGPIQVVVEGNMKVGVFSLAFEDLKVPVAGIPITVTRTYDSRDTRVGDFGPGWRLAVANVRVQKNRNLGIGWYQTLQSGSGIQFYNVDPLGDRIVTVTMPDGQTERFKIGAVVKNRVGDPDDASYAVIVTQGTVKFYPIGDTTSTLEPLDSSNQLASHFFIAGTGDQDLRADDPAVNPLAGTYNATRFRLTTKDGTVYILDEALGLLSLTDLNGNTLVVNRDAQNRVTSIVSTPNNASATATSVTIHRDSTGRVDYIRDPAGKDLDYLYDTKGRLSSFTNRTLDVTQFFYENPSFPYYLTRIVDPRGVNAIRTEYDAAGKMVKQTDAAGNTTVFTHTMDPAARSEKVKDRLGNETTFYYDDRGNVTSKVDPLGAQTTYSYYADSDRVKYQTDHYGNVKSTAYDAAGNPTVETIGASAAEDPANPTTGYSTLTSYNALSAPTRITDPDGRAQTFGYDPATNALVSQTVGTGGSAPATSTFGYNTDGTLKTQTDAAGNVTSYTYEYNFSDTAYPGAVKRVTTTVTDPAGTAGSDPANTSETVLRVTRTLFDGQENQLAQIVTRHLPDGTAQDVVTKYVYDLENRLVATVLPDGRVNETRYNAIGKEDKSVLWKTVADFQAKDDSQARITSYGYDSRGNQTSVTYADGTAEATAFDAENRKQWSQDRRGYRTFYQYDKVGRLRFTIYPDADDGVGAAAPNDPSDARLSDNPRSETRYDLIGRVTDTFDEVGQHTRTVYYDDGTPDALRRKQLVQVHAGGDLTTTYEYDKAGNVRYVTDPRSNKTETQYDDQGRPTFVVYPATDEHPVTKTETRYDAFGRRIAVVDQEGKITRYRYDGLGRLVEVRQYLDQSIAAGDADFHLTPATLNIVSTRYAYDELGNQVTQTDAQDRTTTFWTDGLGRRTKRVLPKDSTESTSLTESLQYDGWGNLWKRTDFSGKTTTFGYDALNRLTSKTADPTHASLAYSHAIARVAYEYDENGARKAARTYNASDTLLYSETTPRDERGRVDYKNTGSGRLDYGYYANNLLKDVVSSNSDGVNIGYRYDDLNRLAHVDDASSGTTHTSDYTYNPNGSLETLTQPNGIVHTYGYDALNRLRTLNVKVGVAVSGGAAVGSVIHGYEYKLYPSGHRHQVLEGARTTTYTYDDLYRLTNEAIAGDAHGNNGSIDYSLDKVGNRLSRNVADSLATRYSLPATANTYNARDWLAGDAYDANGNTVSGLLNPSILAPGSFTDSYDFENRLIVRTKADGSTINVSYDADGNRIAKSILDATAAVASSTTWLVDTNNLTGYAQVVEERVSTGGSTPSSRVKTYAYGNSLLSSATSLNAQASTIRYFTFDGHGNVRELTDSSDVVTDRYDYDAFGNLVFKSGTTTNNYLYCGEQFDPDLGLYYNRARYLNADSGRFWSMDLYEGELLETASLHKYLYANVDPITYRDTSGHMTLAEEETTSDVSGLEDRVAYPSIRHLAEVAAVDIYLCIRGPRGFIPFHTYVYADTLPSHYGWRYDIDTGSILDSFTGAAGTLTITGTRLDSVRGECIFVRKQATLSTIGFLKWQVLIFAEAKIITSSVIRETTVGEITYTLGGFKPAGNEINCVGFSLFAAATAKVLGK